MTTARTGRRTRRARAAPVVGDVFLFDHDVWRGLRRVAAVDAGDVLWEASTGAEGLLSTADWTSRTGRQGTVQLVHGATPEGGPLKRTFVVGGRADFIMERIAPKLRKEWGLDVQWHHDMRTAAAPTIPKHAEIVLIFRDMTGHSHSNAARDGAKAMGIPYVYGERKWAILQQQLMAAGIEPDLTPTAKPEQAKEGPQAVAPWFDPDATATPLPGPVAPPAEASPPPPPPVPARVPSNLPRAVVKPPAPVQETPAMPKPKPSTSPTWDTDPAVTEHLRGLLAAVRARGDVRSVQLVIDVEAGTVEADAEIVVVQTQRVAVTL